MMEIRQQLCELLRVPDGNLNARLVGMKIAPVCERCSGGGEYSYCEAYGRRCFGCGGYGQRAPKPSELPEVLERAKAAVAEGRLEQYLKALAARRECKRGSKRIFAAWGKSRASRILSGWASHVVRDEEFPANGAEVRAANALMYAASERAHAAMRAVEFCKPSAPDYGEIAIAAAQAIEDALAEIAAVDVEPTPEMITFVHKRQRPNMKYGEESAQ